MLGQITPGTLLEEKPCWTCIHFGAMDVAESAICLHLGCSARRSQARYGCSAYVREPGTDDEQNRPPAPAARSEVQRLVELRKGRARGLGMG